MRAKLIEAIRSVWRKKTTVTIEIDGLPDTKKWEGRKLEVDIDIYRQSRSLNANAYFHVLVGKLAEKNGVSKARQKNELITSYGQQLFIDGDIAVMKTNIPQKEILELESPHMKYIKYSEKEHASFYSVWRGSHTYDSREMSELIKGTVAEAHDAGIDTMTPDEIARLTSMWKAKEGYF